LSKSFGKGLFGFGAAKPPKGFRRK